MLFRSWASYYSGKTGLWITGEDKTPIKLSDSFSGDPIWRDDSRRLYYFEGKDLMYADATNFKPQTLVKLADVKIEGIIK